MSAFARTCICCIVLLLAAITVAGAASPPKTKRVHCKDKKFPACYGNNKNLYCPPSCPRTCVVDCSTCQAVCTPPPPPPVKPKKAAKCKDKKSPCYKTKDVLCPSSCPRSCAVDCKTCLPTCPSSPPAAPAKKVKCRNKKYSSCYGQEQVCPSSCPQSCTLDCVTCKPTCNCDLIGGVCQDPRFIGGDGITFYFHGKRDQEFCIVSDTNLHINGHFIGRRNDQMSRDFTWVQSLGILFNTHQLYIGAQKTETWDDSVDRLSLAIDGKSILLPDYEGATWRSTSSPGLTIKRTSVTNAVEIESIGNFRIRATAVPITEKDSLIHNYGITEDDCFAHLDLSFKFYSLTDEVDGILGQTYGRDYVSRAKIGVPMPVLGGERKFASSGLFAADCAASRFVGQLGVNGNGSSHYSN